MPTARNVPRGDNCWPHRGVAIAHRLVHGDGLRVAAGNPGHRAGVLHDGNLTAAYPADRIATAFSSAGITTEE